MTKIPDAKLCRDRYYSCFADFVNGCCGNEGEWLSLMKIDDIITQGGGEGQIKDYLKSFLLYINNQIEKMTTFNIFYNI